MTSVQTRIAFACCNHAYTHRSQPAWSRMTEMSPDVLLLTGDNVYLEDHMWQLWFGKPAGMSDDAFARRLYERYCWQWAVPEFRDLLRSMRERSAPIYGILDDHDFLGNDFYVSPATQAKAVIARALLRQFLNACKTPGLEDYPAIPASTPDQWLALDDPGFAQGLGLAKHLSLGNAQILLLDNRSYRTAPSAQGEALGATQMAWVRDQLSANNHSEQAQAPAGKVTLIFSGSPMSPGQKKWIPGSPLSAYPREYQALLEMYEASTGQTIVHIGGDIHYNDWRDRHPRFGHYEVCCSALGSGWLPFSPHARGNFGIIDLESDRLRIRTFGVETDRNIDKLIVI
jgi:phosphodiesterase/alkaline phosphatase D-like protein